MSNDKFQDKYDDIFQSLKEEKMNWDFEDFMKKTEEKNGEISGDDTLIVPIQTKKPSFPKWFWMAASAVILLGLTFIFNYDNNNVKDKAMLVENEIQKQKTDFINENSSPSSQVAVHYSDSVSGTKKDSVFQENTIAEKDVLDDLLSKKSRIKKQFKPRYVQNTGFENSNAADSTGYKDSYVIVNGKRIDNVEEAINITKYSFQVMATNVNQALSTQVMDDVE